MTPKTLSAIAVLGLSAGTLQAHPQLEDRPASPEVFARAQALCEARIKQRLRDPETARLGLFVRAGLRHEAKTGQVLRDYRVLVKAKQGLSSYIIDKPWGCTLDEQETRVLWVGALG